MPVNAYDYETPNGTEATYRARALHEFDSGDVSVSDWSASDAASWSSSVVGAWVKHPTLPSLNGNFDLRSPATDGISREAREGRFQPLGASKAVVVSDTRGSETGTIRFKCPTDEEKAALRALIDANVPLLLQFDPADHERDRWISLGEHKHERWVDQSWIEGTWQELPWVEVETPGGNIAEDF